MGMSVSPWWEVDYERYLAAVSADDAAPGAGATLLNMVRAAGLHRYSMSMASRP